MAARLHRYEPTALYLEAARASSGLFFTLAPLALIGVPWPLALILGCGAGAFLFRALRCMRRSMTCFEIDAEGITELAPRGRRIGWGELTRVRLRYFRRPSGPGWMELSLIGPSGTIRLCSGVDGFLAIATAVGALIRRRRLPVAESTRRNFGALGVVLPVDALRLAPGVADPPPAGIGPDQPFGEQDLGDIAPVWHRHPGDNTPGEFAMPDRRQLH